MIFAFSSKFAVLHMKEWPILIEWHKILFADCCRAVHVNFRPITDPGIKITWYTQNCQEKIADNCAKLTKSRLHHRVLHWNNIIGTPHIKHNVIDSDTQCTYLSILCCGVSLSSSLCSQGAIVLRSGGISPHITMFVMCSGAWHNTKNLSHVWGSTTNLSGCRRWYTSTVGSASDGCTTRFSYRYLVSYQTLHTANQ